MHYHTVTEAVDYEIAQNWICDSKLAKKKDINFEKSCKDVCVGVNHKEIDSD